MPQHITYDRDIERLNRRIEKRNRKNKRKNKNFDDSEGIIFDDDGAAIIEDIKEEEIIIGFPDFVFELNDKINFLMSDVIYSCREKQIELPSCLSEGIIVERIYLNKVEYETILSPYWYKVKVGEKLMMLHESEIIKLN